MGQTTCYKMTRGKKEYDKVQVSGWLGSDYDEAVPGKSCECGRSKTSYVV
jgi:hypothetical protein